MKSLNGAGDAGAHAAILTLIGIRVALMGAVGGGLADQGFRLVEDRLMSRDDRRVPDRTQERHRPLGRFSRQIPVAQRSPHGSQDEIRLPRCPLGPSDAGVARTKSSA